MSFTKLKDETAIKTIGAQTGDFLLVFVADFCGPCKPYLQSLEKALDEDGKQYTVLIADVKDCPQLAQHYLVAGVPMTVAFDHEHQPIRSVQGALTQAQISELLINLGTK